MSRRLIVRVEFYSKTNDPLEGAGHNINIQGWTGQSIQYYADEELGPIERIKEKYGILSLSEEAQSPQMWAYYGDNYKGICFCFSTNGALEEAKKVKYSNYTKEKKPWSDYQLEKDIRNGFYQKSAGWKYEKEWRIIRRLNEEKEYLFIKPDELVGIIIGHRMDEGTQREIIELIPNNIKVLKTRIGYQHPEVHLQPIDYEYIYDGTPIEYIEDLEKYLLE